MFLATLAPQAAVDRQVAQIDQAGVRTFFGRTLQHRFHQSLGIGVFPGTGINADNFHDDSSALTG
jgi:hypothetical protein